MHQNAEILEDKEYPHNQQIDSHSERIHLL